jgi:hypothetical protein
MVTAPRLAGKVQRERRWWWFHRLDDAGLPPLADDHPQQLHVVLVEVRARRMDPEDDDFPPVACLKTSSRQRMLVWFTPPPAQLSGDSLAEAC